MLDSNTTTQNSPLQPVDLAAWRAKNSHLSPMGLCVAAQSLSSAGASEWRDIFCHQCETNETTKGTAEQLAEKVLALGWIVERGQQFDVLCPVCREVN